MKKILLIDGYNLIYRARYSGMNRGENSTIYNYFRGLRPIVEKFNPDFAFMILEGKPVKRLEMHPEYKGQRQYHNKDDFERQKLEIIDMSNKYFPIQMLRHENYECDDVIGYLAEKYKADHKVTILSSDTDFIQCIDDNVELYNPVTKKFLEKPSYDYVLYKSLRGDNSDNIEGFKGIGDKRAQKLSLDSDKLKEFLLNEGYKEKLDKNMQMIKLHDLTEEKDNIIYFSKPTRDWESVKDKFNEYRFSSMINEKSWNKFTDTFENLWRNL